jgi:hypothetical protein
VTVTTAVPQCPDVDDPEPVSPVNTPKTRTWVEASKLKKGEHLKADNGQDAVADGGHTPAQHDGWMWDLTIQDDHDFYVLPARDGSVGQYYYVDEDGVSAVLVHNYGAGGGTACGAYQAMQRATALQKQAGWSGTTSVVRVRSLTGLVDDSGNPLEQTWVASNKRYMPTGWRTNNSLLPGEAFKSGDGHASIPTLAPRSGVSSRAERPPESAGGTAILI